MFIATPRTKFQNSVRSGMTNFTRAAASIQQNLYATPNGVVQSTRLISPNGNEREGSDEMNMQSDTKIIQLSKFK